MNELRERLAQARLYLVCDALSDAVLSAALRGGVDVVQLRMKDATDAEIAAAGHRYRGLCDAAGALLIINDRPDLVPVVGADGVHVGQDDVPVAEAAALVGAERLVGLSTHSPAQIDFANQAGADYIGVGPVHATPTKPGRAPVGLALVEHAAAHARMPFFAIGGVDLTNAATVVAAGAQRLAVVRAIAQAPDPERAARRLRAVTAEPQEARVGAA